MSETVEPGFCSESNDGCKAPAGWGIDGGGGYYDSEWDEHPAYAKATCYSCGQPVCGSNSCSKRVTYDKARRRLCLSCIADRFESGWR